MKTINVIARSGICVPMQSQPNVCITDSKAVEIPLTTYYRRRLKEGDLRMVDDKKGGKS